MRLKAMEGEFEVDLRFGKERVRLDTSALPGVEHEGRHELILKPLALKKAIDHWENGKAYIPTWDNICHDELYP